MNKKNRKIVDKLIDQKEKRKREKSIGKENEVVGEVIARWKARTAAARRRRGGGAAGDKHTTHTTKRK